MEKIRDTSVDSVRILTIPHIYSFNSSCYYQGYGLADLALEQWRAYFYKKYGYIVDNPAVGKELKEAWSTGSRYTFAEEVKRATGKPLSAEAWIKSATRTPSQAISIAKKRSQKVATLSRSQKPIQLNASIVMSHGKEVVSTNKKSFEEMAEVYAKWLENCNL